MLIFILSCERKNDNKSWSFEVFNETLDCEELELEWKVKAAKRDDLLYKVVRLNKDSIPLTKGTVVKDSLSLVIHFSNENRKSWGY